MNREPWEIEMFKAAQELLGRGYVDEYYWSAASDFIAIARNEIAAAKRKANRFRATDPK